MFTRMLTPTGNNPIAQLIHNENGAVQVSREGLSEDKKKAAYVELFLKLVRGNESSDMINENVATILKYNADNEIADAVDGLFRQMAMTRSFRVSTGKGEKKQSQNLMLGMYKYMPNLMNYVIPIASKEVGCWKDVVVMSEYCIDIGLYPDLVKAIATAQCKAIQDGDYLASKWAPRENSFYKKVAKYYVKHMYGNSKQSSYKKYRQLVQHNCSGDTNFLLETAMSENNWDYVGQMLPTLTALNHSKYKKAFDKHIKQEYSEYLMDVANGNKKLNTTGLHIDGIVKTMLCGNACYGCHFNDSLKENEIILMNLQWKKFEDDMVKILLDDEDAYATFANQVSVVDRSGSMSEVSSAAVGIGLFVAKVLGRAGREKYGKDHVGFGDVVIRFSDKAEIIALRPTDNFNEYLNEYITKENKFHCGYTTNIMSVHETIVGLTKAAKLSLAPDLLILTDMQYNDVCNSMNGWSGNPTHTNTSFEDVTQYYKKNEIGRGETRCWNLRGGTKTFDATAEEQGVVMIGGFNQSMLTLFVEGKKVAVSNGKESAEVTTWDTFKASQHHYNMATKWMTSGVNIIKDVENLSEVEKQLIVSIPTDYVSDWMEICPD
jgi:hypothetical protein